MDFGGFGVGWGSGPALESPTIHRGENWANVTSTAERNPESTPAMVYHSHSHRGELLSLWGLRGSSAHTLRVSFPPGEWSLPGSVKLPLCSILGCLLTLFWFSHQENREAQSGRGTQQAGAFGVGSPVQTRCLCDTRALSFVGVPVQMWMLSPDAVVTRTLPALRASPGDSHGWEGA